MVKTLERNFKECQMKKSIFMLLLWPKSGTYNLFDLFEYNFVIIRKEIYSSTLFSEGIFFYT